MPRNGLDDLLPALVGLKERVGLRDRTGLRLLLGVYKKYCKQY